VIVSGNDRTRKAPVVGVSRVFRFARRTAPAA